MIYKIDIKKRILSLILIPVIVLTISFCDYKKVYAVVGVDDVLLASMAALVTVVIATEQSDDYQSWYENDWRPKSREVIRQGLNVISGTSISPDSFDELFPLLGPDPIQEIRLYLANRNSVEPSTITDDEVKQFTYNMFDNSVVNEDNDSFSVSSDLNNYFHYCIDQMINNSGFRYVYTFNIINHATEFASGDAYQITRDFIQTYQPEGKVCAYSNYYRKIMLADLSNCAFVRTQDVSGRYEVTPYNLNTWEAVRGYEYSFDGTQYAATGASGNQMRAQVKVAPTQTGELGLWSWCTSGGNNVYKMYLSLADLKADSVGQAPYYFNNSVYYDWSTSSGDYVVTTDNSNKATYGDITSYIDSFNTEYGRYPSDTDIFKWIEDYNPTVNPTPTPGPDNPSGSGSFVNNNSPSITNNPTFNNNPNINITLFPSVSDNGLNGGTVSGNGGQGSIGNIFDWMGNLGNVIANLIKNVGEMIVKALQGVIEAVTTILNGIPNILTPIIEFVFGGLPDELQALISLGITCIIFVGIIKVIKR